ncbi:N-acetylmuramoyl-L-alanine amidase [Nonomuraea cavernae]|uniref:MurNAc-LAA domain-containing protein n=1 Tax=Nonomuraea cavernae TaxID=2045107 RepID=A0A917YNH1_9ACTN|nr:N-acetylmuramoyl-L-alanine amidase [Nonomuraea cavernae]MCA2183505.1 N-acetylmuramoyl-L-alanine amidase [Nonomuraea cavernae]GGO60496.1 hypothetical protein GCM10012289_00500 [Nonomuraea cavernae]
MRPLPASVLAACGLIASACGAAATGGSAAGQADAPAPVTAAPAPAAAAAVANPLDGKVIVLDPGHNGGNYRDPAAVNRKVNVLTQWKACDTTGTQTTGGYTEAAFTWDVANRTAKILKNRGAKVKLTRSDNDSVGPCITERAAIGNKAKANAVISIHADGSAPGNRGFHVIMPKKINGPVDPVVADSRRLGIDIRDAYRKGTGLPYSTYIGSKALDFRNDLGGLNLSTVPKVFIETGNMKNPAEAAKFGDAKFREQIALALANGLQRYFTS